MTARLVFAMFLGLIVVSHAQAQSFTFQDGVSYQPNLHPIAVRGLSPLPYDLGGIRPGVHVEDLYNLRFREELFNHQCTYRSYDVRSTCRFDLSSKDLPGFDAAVRLEAGVDRRTGTILSVWVRPPRLGAVLAMEEVHELLIERWGNPTEATEACVKWSLDRMVDDDGSRYASEVALCETAQDVWQIRLLDAKLEQTLRDFGDSPGGGGTFSRDEWFWYPVWVPREILGVHAGMDAEVAAAQLGARPSQMRCNPTGLHSGQIVCELGDTGIELAGVPVVGRIEVDKDGWLRSLSLETRSTGDEEEALRWHAIISAVLEERWGPRDPGERERWPARSWVDSPFQTTIQKLWAYGSNPASEGEQVYSIRITTSVIESREGPR